MKEINIDKLAYLLKQSKVKNQPKPIFFLGAGASRTGEIPLASEISAEILKEYSENPFVMELPDKSKTYANLMDCLNPAERDELLKKYIDKAKINVTHIYLAQLLKEDFVDYILTVNFDNLVLRALALYNIFPATYDMAILKDLTTTTFKEKSVVYLHGQSHGLWLLNTPEEMDKVKSIIPRIFDSIKNKRPWVFIGYSGEDPIFDHIMNLGRFDNGLYWITYNDNEPKDKIQTFLKKQNTNSFLIKGYDSDAFMVKLNSALGLGQPIIVDKPFTALKEMLDEIVDIDDKEYFRGVKERLEISIRQVKEAIQQYEHAIIESATNLKEKSKIDLLKKEIINLIIAQDYREKDILKIEKRIDGISDVNLQKDLSRLYSNWGAKLGGDAESKEGEKSEELLHQAIEKIQKAIEIKPDLPGAYNNLGKVLATLAKTKKGEEVSILLQQAIENYQKSIEIKPDYYVAMNNWGNALFNLAKTKEGEEAENLFHHAKEKYQKAIEIKPDLAEALTGWGDTLNCIASTKKGEESEKLFQQAKEKYLLAIEIKPDLAGALNNRVIAPGALANTK
ncbi:MAG: SIR2 family protein [Bacteroidota bacterium]